MKNNFVTHHCITHKAQNIRYHQRFIDDFLRYTQRQIVAGKYNSPVILNMDETNIDFDETNGTTLAKIGNRSVSGKINGHPGRVMVVLCCTMSGEKLPVLVIWKGVANGQIARECRGPQYPHNNIKYAMQDIISSRLISCRAVKNRVRSVNPSDSIPPEDQPSTNSPKLIWCRAPTSMLVNCYRLP